MYSWSSYYHSQKNFTSENTTWKIHTATQNPYQNFNQGVLCVLTPFHPRLTIPTNKSQNKVFNIEQSKVPSRLHLEKDLVIPSYNHI